MIGQNNLLNKINAEIEENKFPRFSILLGDSKIGKLEVANSIAGTLRANKYLLEDCKVDTIRNMIESSYKFRIKSLYIIPDADSMSVSAKNALLKIVEEPPNDVYYIMLAENEDTLLPTIKSRARIYTLDNYAKAELYAYYWNYAESVHKENPNDAELIRFCDTPDEVKTAVDLGISDFYDYVTLVTDNIGKVSGSNSFKIANKIAIKDTDTGYDLKLFFKAFMYECMRRLTYKWESFDLQKYTYGIHITSKYLSDLRIKGINKQMLVDSWIMDIRKEWIE